ncbi:stalk domain-containing protein [Paenibacillus sp. M2]|uniref:stalk domain-containing protein n=1 Tax=Paenibacillus sp. M2 TaxID=3341793 RepID=UPI003989B671
MKDKLKGLVIGILIGSTITGATAFAASGTPIKAVIQKVSLYVDGSKKSTTDAITYKNTTYVPVRAMSNAIGEKVSLKEGNLYIGEQGVAMVSLEKAITLLYEKAKEEADEYDLKFMNDGIMEGKFYLFRAFQETPNNIIPYGDFLVDIYTGDVYAWDEFDNTMVEL